MPNKRQPDTLKLIKGTAKKSRINKSEPKPTLSRAAAPPDFLDEMAVAEWERVTPELEATRVLTNLDLGVLAAYCVSMAQLAEACKHLQSGDYVYETETKDGGTRQFKSPWIEIRNLAQKNLISAATELGMTPASRGKVSSSEGGKSDNPWNL